LIANDGHKINDNLYVVIATLIAEAFTPPEWQVPWLPGYGNSLPVRIGNAAHSQGNDHFTVCCRVGMRANSGPMRQVSGKC
ncbi:MAG: hypothetical protein WCF41_06260, partial [Pseudolabrys sp.]